MSLLRSMNAEEFVLIPKKDYLKDRPIAEQILQDPKVKEKALQLSMLQRWEPTEQLNVEEETQPITTLKETTLRQLEILTVTEQRKSEYIFDEITASARLGIDNSGHLLIDNTSTGLAIGSFLYDLQKSSKKIDIPLYETLFELLHIPEHMVTNTYAKQIINEKAAKAISKATTPHSSKKSPLKPSPSKASRSQWGKGQTVKKWSNL